MVSRYLKGLPDIHNGDGENRFPNGNFHTVYDCHGKRDFQRCFHALAGFAGNAYHAADFFHVLLYYVHAYAPAGVFGNFRIGREAGHHQQVQDFLMRVFAFRLRQKAVVCGFLEHFVCIYALPVVLNGNDDFTAGMLCGKDDPALRAFPGGNTFFNGFFDTVVHRVADDVHNRVADAVQYAFVNFGFFADDIQRNIFAQLLAHIAHDTVHFIEHARNGEHADAHSDILQFICQLAQLPCGFCEIVQLDALQIG